VAQNTIQMKFIKRLFNFIFD